MKGKIQLLILILILGMSLQASPADSISTTYKDHEFITYYRLGTTIPDSISNEVINKFVNQMCYNLDELFKWGLKGMSLANNKDELLIFDFKETRFDRKTNILKGIGDVVVTGVTKFPNICIESKVTQRKFSNGNRDIRLDMVTPNPFIKTLNGVFTFIPKNRNRNGFYVLQTHIRFGWFFDIFITQSRYKKIMEWRIKQLVRNMREEAEKLEKNSALNKR